eukprot:GHVU01218565.1.p1 GENE.GHVU01218565.1~~GHVU01218565.1.p1  ORF type:complete len:107 (-),score=4.93 GHVU01218565.1:769-1089(-)
MRVLPQMTNAHDGNSKVATTAALAESWSVWRESSMWKLLRGSLSGGLAKTCVYPLDRVKMVYQVIGARGQFRLRDIFRELRVIATGPGGPASLWKGNLASIVRFVS